jgi:hypothetical protein
MMGKKADKRAIKLPKHISLFILVHLGLHWLRFCRLFGCCVDGILILVVENQIQYVIRKQDDKVENLRSNSSGHDALGLKDSLDLLSRTACPDVTVKVEEAAEEFFNQLVQELYSVGYGVQNEGEVVEILS